uniref:Uncharacterized protein n=2 Tax=Canis lupus familiaris TaxID=9615 RepID=A0A8C0TWV7_CANLF
MSTVHEILCKLSLEGDQSMPPSAYGLVKVYTNFDAERYALNNEMAIKTKERNEVEPYLILLCFIDTILEIFFVFLD